MIYITGDTHGQIDIDKFIPSNFPQGSTLSKNDYMIICGDFGAIWDGGELDKLMLGWWEGEPYTVLFVDGNHENHKLLNSYPIEIWNGGKIHRIRPNIIHLMRGQVFTIENKKFFTMGGAESIDKYLRKKDISWWEEELPSEEEYMEGFNNLQLHNDRVDYIIAHCAPDSIQSLINPTYMHNRLTNYLEILCSTVKFKQFYCGHYHFDKSFGKYRILYNDIIAVGLED